MRNLVIGVIAVVLIAVGGFAFWWTQGNTEVTGDVQEEVERLEADSAEARVFSIDPEQSQAAFYIDEVLRGEDVTVEGVTQMVAGDIQVNAAAPAESEVGEIRINARDLTTDADNRNRALQRFILNSDQDEYEFIVFNPSSLANMPEAVTVGEEFTFQVTGDLTIKDVTNEVTFDVTVTPTSETQIEGTAEATVLYQDFDLTIPDVPFVASVEDDVRLVLSFVAVDATEDETAEG